MNVRIEEQSLRFKISEEELKTLLDGRCVHAKVDLLGKVLVVTINPSGQAEDMHSRLVLEEGEAYLNLLVPPGKVRALCEMGRSRAGLEQQIGALFISLQVDVRSDTRKVCKA